MKVILLLSLIGLALYAALVVSDKVLPIQRSKKLQETQNTSARLTRSWGSDLTTLVTSRALDESSSALQRDGSIPERPPGLAHQIPIRQLSTLEPKETQAVAPTIANSSKRMLAKSVAKNRTRSDRPHPALRPETTFAEFETPDREWILRRKRRGPGLFFFNRFATRE
jgi:hypothetical protein